MRAKHDLFNAVGVVIAVLILSIAWNCDFGSIRPEIILLSAILLLILIGGGSLINFFNRTLLPGPTKSMILGYFLSVVLIPFGIWGLVLLKKEHHKATTSRRHRHRRSYHHG